ncbi:MAG: cupredoxin domain-containing protein [Gammaproteobacteria bacterium]
MKSLIFMVLLTASTLCMAEMQVFELHIKDHQFNPAQLEIPAGVKVKLLVKNQDPTPEEFESHDLNREKVIPGNSEAIVYVGPLDPGTYGFFGEFHMDTAQGKLIVK